MKRLALLLTALVLLWGLSAPAFALEDGDPVGALSRAPKAPEDETPYITQCELGSMTGDAVRKAAGSDIALVSAADLTGRLPSGLVTWAEYLLGTDPTNALSRLEATIRMDGTTPIVESNADTNRLATFGYQPAVKGKQTLDATAEWAATNSSHRFFKVFVEMRGP